MADHIKSFLPRFRYGMIHPRSHEDRARGAGYQFYRLVPLDVMEFSAVLGITNYTLEAVEKALANYWKCVETLANEKAQVIILGGAPVSAALGRKRVVDLLRQTTEKTTTLSFATWPMAASMSLGLPRETNGAPSRPPCL